jgi:hypothetical protein
VLDNCPSLDESAQPAVSSPRHRAYELSPDTPPYQTLLDHFRCPEHIFNIHVSSKSSQSAGYFPFGQDACEGGLASGSRGPSVCELIDSLSQITIDDRTLGWPFDLTEVVDKLRLERYSSHGRAGSFTVWEEFLKRAYYILRPLMHRRLRTYLQRARLGGWRRITFPRWPVDTTVEDIREQFLRLYMYANRIEKIPFIWFWPDGATGCVAMTHDIETEEGKNFCTQLMDIDDSFGIKSSFQVVPEGRYRVPIDFGQAIRARGFELNIHDLNHDGFLFRDYGEFSRRAQRINRHADELGAAGFRSAVLYRNLDWYDSLQCSFDMSVPNVAHLDPQRGGCCTIMPYFIGKILEIPLTTTQDYMLFHLLDDYSLDLWKTQISMILAKNGLVSFLVHPDYIIEKRAQRVYRELLALLHELRLTRKPWFALPGQIDDWWRARHGMRIVAGGNSAWRIEGDGAERAKLAFVCRVDDRLEYQLAD